MVLGSASVFRVRIITRVVAVLLAVGITVVFPPQIAMLAYYAFALAHFILAFMYQRDAGKWNQNKLLAGGAFFLIIASVWNVYPTLGFFLTSLAFVIHMMLDETHLLGGTPSRMRTLESLPYVLLWVVISLRIGFEIDIFFWGYFLVGVLVLVRVMFHSIGHAKMDGITATLLTWGFLTMVACVLIQTYGVMVPATLWFFGIANIHFFLWYGDYYFRVAHDATKRITYLRRILVINTLTFFLAGLFSVGAVPILILFFGQAYVNAWSLLHIVSSIRGSTLRTAVTARA